MRRFRVTKSQMIQQPSDEAETASDPVLGLTAMALTADLWSFIVASMTTLPVGDTCSNHGPVTCMRQC